MAFSPWSPGLGAVRVLWAAPLSSVRGVTLEPAHEGIKVSLASPVQFSTDHQVRLEIFICDFLFNLSFRVFLFYFGFVFLFFCFGSGFVFCFRLSFFFNDTYGFRIRMWFEFDFHFLILVIWC